MKLSWIPYKPQIGKLLKMILPNNMVVPILQGRLKGTKWIVGSSNIECALGSYEYEKRIVFEKEVSKSSVVYDIGAHVGFYTLLASELVSGGGRVIAFEPAFRNLKYLKKHVEINHCANVKIIEAAVSDKSGISHFNEGHSSSMGHLSEDGNLTVDTVSIDKLVGAGKIPAPDYIKIDVEGAELLVLKGAKST
ncbi:MAG: FkbM family methyltransferase, partial [Methanophagales archaeon]|nr:FkbM family methyltransferase [Methanophagales archaeon]